MTNEAQVKVRRGALLLDRHLQNWRDVLDLEALDMNDAQSCVLGQLFGSYTRGLVLLGLAAGGGGVGESVDAFQNSEDHGFTGKQFQQHWIDLLTPFEFTCTLNRRQAYLLASLLNAHVASTLAAEIGILPELLKAVGTNYPSGVHRDGYHPLINHQDPNLPD